MQKYLAILFSLFSQTCFSQNAYELFESYNTEFLKKQNSKIISVTGFRNLNDSPQKIISYKEFSPAGLPTKIVEYDENSIELRTIEFIYTSSGQPSMINTFQNGKKFTTTEFYYDSVKILKYFKEYVYSSLDGNKMLLWKTDFEYYHNKKSKTILKLEVSDVLPKQDTVEIIFFDTSGVKTKSYFDMTGYRQTRIYKWNQDKTEMTEYDYNADSLQSTILHKYKGEYEIERSENGSDRPVLFWKYDKKNRLTQTNSAIFFSQDFTYDSEGYLVKEIWTAAFPELVKDNDFKKMPFRYEYKFRK
jgi:YD repeat-containing protein